MRVQWWSVLLVLAAGSIMGAGVVLALSPQSTTSPTRARPPAAEMVERVDMGDVSCFVLGGSMQCFKVR